MEYKRICPKCGNGIIHTGVNAVNNGKRLEKLNKQCRKCDDEDKKIKYLGENNPFYNRKHTEEFKSRISEERKGKHISINTELKKGHKLNDIYNNPKYSLIKLLEENNETFYWMGFILADGSFYKNRFEFSLQKKDYDHVVKFSKFMGGLPVVKHKESFRCAINNRFDIPIIKEKYDIKDRKTYNPPDFKNYEHYSDDLLYSLLFGIIDGDGCIFVNKNTYIYTIAITAHKSWEKFYVDFMKRLNITHYVNQRKNSNIITIKIGQKKNVIAMRDKINELQIIKLERKWEKIVN
jgi:hypothetical protein